jgi:hypothetical protein
MKKRIHWSTIIVIIVFLLIAGFFASFIMAFYGNPITSAIATAKIRKYVEATYSDMDLEIPKANYNFKFDEYVSHVSSKSSQDTKFSVSWSDGKINDSYEEDVKKLYNTLDRINKEFSEKVEEIIIKDFPYQTSILFATLGEGERDFDQLSLDMQLDITNPPMKAKLVIYIMTAEVSYDFLIARLQELHQLMGKYEIPVDQYTVVIQEPLIEGEEKPAPNGDSIHLIDFPAEKINSEELLSTIKEHQRAWEEQHQK